MHDTALRIGCLAMDTYASTATADILEIGASNINGSLRDHAAETVHYIGVDFDPGPGVDIVIEPGAPLPVPDEEFDLVIASSVLEHDPAFWMTFLEMCRKARPGGYIYINVPSNGEVHRYPSDNWRFYPDSGRALAQWAVSQGMEIALVESFVAAREADNWNDFVAVFRKGDAGTPLPGTLLHQQVAGTNVWVGDNPEPLEPQSRTEDMVLLDTAHHEATALRAALDKSERQIGYLHAARETFEEQHAQDRQHAVDLDRTLQERQNEIADITRELAHTQRHVEDLRGSSARMEEDIRDREAARLAQDERSQQADRHIADLNRSLQEQEAAMAAMERELTDTQGQVADLRGSSARLEQEIRQLDSARLARDAQSERDRHRIADLESTLLQRQEEIAQTNAALADARDRVAALDAETARLAGREADLVEKLGIESAWVFRLAGERQAAEKTAEAALAEQARSEHLLQAALRRVDDLDARLISLRQAVSDAYIAAERDAETIAEMAAERAHFDRMTTDHDEMVAAIRADGRAALAAERSRHDRTIAEQADRGRAELEEVRRDAATRIADRFGETAMLTRLLRDEEDARRCATTNVAWLGQLHAAMADLPWWLGLLPPRLRRRVTAKRLLRRRLFDSDAYLASYPDVAAAGMDALQHYILHGMGEGRGLPELL